MSELVPAVIGWVTFVLFVGFVSIKVGAAPLLIVVAGAVLLATVDVVQNVRTAFVNDARRRDAAARGG